jgi:hypothetical protein
MPAVTGEFRAGGGGGATNAADPDSHADSVSPQRPRRPCSEEFSALCDENSPSGNPLVAVNPTPATDVDLQRWSQVRLRSDHYPPTTSRRATR